MLKKSLKIGSILLLIFAMVAFMGCDSGSTESEPDDTPAGPVNPDPDKPGPVDPEPPVETVTGITIEPGSLEILAGAKQLFTATVKGTAADKTVKYSVAIADTDYYHKQEDGTSISDLKGGNAGMLVIDGGQVPGTVLTVKATSNADPSVYAEATVKVVKPGPRLAWTPPVIAVTTGATGDDGAIDGDAVSVGRFLDIAGKEIRFVDGEYVEGQHYSVRRVDNLNNSLLGGTITILGSRDEGTVTVTLNGNVVGDKGPIGITLYQTVLEGADASVIDLEASELVYNITSAKLITGLSSLSDFTKPLKGSVPLGFHPKGAVVGGAIRIDDIEWTGLTSGQYTHRNEAVATITLKAESGYKFYTPGISESTITAKFQTGSPKVALIDKKEGSLKFTLTYTVAAKTIRAVATTPAPAPGQETYVLADFINKLDDFIVEGLVSHGQEAPTALRMLADSPYYSLSEPVEWTGLTGKTFFGGNLAVATITIPAKPGYTFEGTDITAGTLVGSTAIFKKCGDVDSTPGADSTSATMGEIISADDKLVFTVSYYVPKTRITPTDIAKYVTGKLPVPLHNATPQTNLTVHKTAPFTGGTGVVNWGGLSVSNKFDLGVDPVATITLLANPGYEFSSAQFISGQPNNVPPNAVSVNGTATQTIFNLGNKLVFSVSFTDAVKVQIATFAETTFTFPAVEKDTISTSLVGSFGGDKSLIDTTPVTGSTFAVSTITPTPGGDNKLAVGAKVTARAELKPTGTTTFAGFNVAATATDNRAAIKNLFKDEDGALPEITALGIINGTNLLVELEYTARKIDLVAANVSSLGPLTKKPTIGDNQAAVGNITSGTSVIVSPDPVWTGFPVTAGTPVTYTLVLVPNPTTDYTFKGVGGSTKAAWEGAFKSLTAAPNVANVTINENDTLTVVLTWNF
jgi:hypothetical protein